MQAHKFLLTTNAQGKHEGLPELLLNQHVELIVLFNEETASQINLFTETHLLN